jgi:parallel beta-helix repeat protein
MEDESVCGPIRTRKVANMNIRVHLQDMVGLICGLVLLGGLVNAQQGEAGTYYVATNGNDSNSGTENQPFRTLRKGVSALRPGDTLLVKNGRYTGGRELLRTPSGTSWSNPVTIAAYPGHSPVIVKPGQSPHTLHFDRNRYLVIKGFFIDGSNATNGIKITSGYAGRASHIRIQDSTIAHAGADGIFVTAGSDGNQFINLHVRSNGKGHLNHGIYIKSSGNLIEGCSITNNKGWGVHLWRPGGGVNNNIIRNNDIYGNGDGGITIHHGSGNQAYNNVIRSNMKGIRVRSATNTYVADNTIQGNAE